MVYMSSGLADTRINDLHVVWFSRYKDQWFTLRLTEQIQGLMVYTSFGLADTRINGLHIIWFIQIQGSTVYTSSGFTDTRINGLHVVRLSRYKDQWFMRRLV